MTKRFFWNVTSYVMVDISLCPEIVDIIFLLLGHILW
jgi:hypothetical protein